MGFILVLNEVRNLLGEIYIYIYISKYNIFFEMSLGFPQEISKIHNTVYVL